MKNLVKFTLVALTFSVLGLSACAKKQETAQDAAGTEPATATVDSAATAPAADSAATANPAPQQ